MTASSVLESPGIGQPLPYQQHCVYLDYNATTPIFPEVAEAMQPFLQDCFGNPSSGHAYGKPCREAVLTARRRVAELIGAVPEEIYFTACGTESDNWAIWGAISARGQRQGVKSTGDALPHVVTSAVEHPAVLECLSGLRDQGLLAYAVVEVDSEGVVDPASVEAAITPATCLVSIMHSNNEVGAVQPVAAIAAVAARHGALLHTDAAQSIGKVEVDVDELGVDLLTVVGHKFGAPKGVAALYVRRGTPMGRLLHGGGQEGGMRAGTENVLLIAALGAAAALAAREGTALWAHLAAMRDRLQSRLLAHFPKADIRVNGPADDRKRLPNTLSVSLRGIDAAALLQGVSDRLAASAGSACHADAASVSPVLQAMKVPTEFAMGTLRLSTGRHTTAEDVDRAAEIIIAAAGRQRR